MQNARPSRTQEKTWAHPGTASLLARRILRRTPWNTRACHPEARRGAALIVVIAIMTILLAIGLTFFAVSRMEVRTATNVSNTVRTELLGDAAVAIAVAALNQDLLDHPTATSLDHGWRSIFSGAWAAGKPWAWKDGNKPPTRRGAVQVNMNDFLGLYVRFGDGIIEPLYQGPRTRTWMYIPRAEVPAGYDPALPIPVILYDEQAQLTTVDGSGNYVTVAGAPPVVTVRAGKPDERSYAFYNFTFNEALIQAASNFLGPRQVPFLTSSFFGAPAHLLDDGDTLAPLAATQLLGQLGDLSVPAYPIEQVARFTDVDNDGNGVNDSMWIPLQEDEFYPGDGVDNDLDGLLDESQENGVNEDADTLTDQIVNVSSVVSDPDEAIEGAPFVYHGLGPFLEGRRVGDGLDNDGDGVVDDGLPGIPDPAGNGLTEDKYFLTSPLPGIEVYVDLDGDGQAYDLVPVNPANPNTDFQPLRMRLPGRIQVLVKVGNDQTFVTLGPEDVDVLDNDFDLLANDYATYAYVGPNNGQVAPLTFNGFAQDPINGTWRLADPVLGPAGILNTLADDTNGVEPTEYTAWFFEQNGQWLQPGNWDERDKDLFNKQRKRGFNDLNRPASLVDLANEAGTDFYPNAWLSLLPNPDEVRILRAAVRITHSGEPVCRLVGRAAIQIADVAGKVNLNTAGAMSYRPDYNYASGAGPLQLASSAGATPGEYDLRMLPDFGLRLVEKLWGLRTGAPGGIVFPTAFDPNNPGEALGVTGEDPLLRQRLADGTYYADVSLPGYGRIDDNVDALLIGSNGIDDDGDGLIDEGTRVPSPTDPDYPLLPQYLAQLGILEGTDEPGELQRFNPLRNRVAENDFGSSPEGPITIDGVPVDNDNDGFANEVGELGDRMLLSKLQIQDASQIGPVTAAHLEDDLTVHSTDRSIAFLNAEEGLKTIRKVDYALATPQQIAEALIIRGGDEGVTRREGLFLFSDFAANAFADGLRQADVHLRAPILTSGPAAGTGGFLHTLSNPLDPGSPVVPTLDNLPPDPILQAMQTAVNVVDSRDRDHTRSVLKLNEPGDGLYVPSDQRLSLQGIETRLADEINIGDANLSLRDAWWGSFVTAGVDDDGDGYPDEDDRYIQYATAGNEAIKINELMVRPVRRVEAEMQSSRNIQPTTYDAAGGDVDAILALHNSEAIYAFGPVEFNPRPAPYPELPLFDMSVQAGSDWSQGGTVLGPSAGWATATSNPVEDGAGVIQFTFRPTDGVPPGRYYLMMNSTAADGTVTVTEPDAIEYSIKYSFKYIDLADPSTGVQIGEGDIVTDLAAVVTAADLGGSAPDPSIIQEYLDTFFKELPNDDFIGRVPDNGGERLTGQVFFPGTTTLNFDPTASPLGAVLPSPGTAGAYYFSDGFQPVNLAASTYTVELLAPYVDVATNLLVLPELNVAVRINDAASTVPSEVAINSFDFSQEPDHEYIELANTSEETVDVSGWELEVGPPRERKLTVAEEAVERPRFRIPEGTNIAPGGMILLTTSKFDFFQMNDLLNVQQLITDGRNLTVEPLSLIERNGIGMARGLLDTTVVGTDAGALLGVTVPPFANVLAINRDPAALNPADAFDPTDITETVYEATGSVFDRSPIDAAGLLLTAPMGDYVDRLGDGIPWRISDDELVADAEGAPVIQGRWIRDDVRDKNNDGLIAAQDGWREARDVVDLEATVASSYVPLQDDNVPGLVAPDKPWDRIVQLEATSIEGISAPERLAALVLRGGILPNYPEEDGIDNDGDNGYDSGAPLKVEGALEKDGIDNDGDLVIDEYGEGIDEGRNFMSAAFPNVPYFESGTPLPYTFANNKSLYTLAIADLIANGTRGDGIAYDPAFVQTLNNLGLPPADLRHYAGDYNDPPEWKNFVERRWYPGDNVVVTLYEGRALDGRIADRVTYTQADVENRTIDDIVTYPGNPASFFNFDYPTWWPKNQMGLDFYKALERKSPHMAGDRFGTTNRWEATDGNYDDWAESPSPYVRVMNITPYPPQQLAVETRTVTDTEIGQQAMNGSPLSMNLAQRISENPVQTVLDTPSGVFEPREVANPLSVGYRVHQFPRSSQFLAGTSDGGVRRWDAVEWAHRLAKTGDDPFASLGDLLTVPQVVQEHYMYNGAQIDPTFLWSMPMTAINYAVQYAVPGQADIVGLKDIDLRGVTLGQANTDPLTPNPLNAVADVTTTNPLTLTVGAATVTPGTATLNALNNVSAAAQGALTTWETAASGAVVRGPGVWLPVLSYRFDAEQGVDQRDLYYLNGGSLGGIPLEDRYVSLFRAETLLNDPFFATVNPETYFGSPGDPASRQPFTSRALMYVAQINDTVLTATGDPIAPRMLLEWGPEDGLEGGTYDIYLGTYIPGLVDRLTTLLPGNLNAAAAALGGATVDPVLDNRLLDPASLIQELPDPLSRRSQDAGFCVGAECPDYMLRTAVATTRLDRTRLLAIGVGNQNFGLLNEVHPRSDGYAYLGTVKIRDDENYLGVFVELPTQGAQVPKRLNMVTHVVLAPRDRTPGKINVNTTEVRARHQDVEYLANQDQLFTALMGLPGYVPPGVSRDDDIAAPGTGVGSLTGQQASRDPWTAPSDITGGADMPPFSNDRFTGLPGTQSAQLASLTTMGRTEHTDGRYYARVTDLALDDSGFNRAQNDGVTPGALAASGVDQLYPLSVSQDAEARFADILQRYPAISNLITTRSDVFEIIATVQSGYGLDQDGDGFINYRNNDEFVTTAESKVRTVYERRVPEAGE